MHTMNYEFFSFALKWKIWATWVNYLNLRLTRSSYVNVIYCSCVEHLIELYALIATSNYFVDLRLYLKDFFHIKTASKSVKRNETRNTVCDSARPKEKDRLSAVSGKASPCTMFEESAAAAVCGKYPAGGRGREAFQRARRRNNPKKARRHQPIAPASSPVAWALIQPER